MDLLLSILPRRKLIAVYNDAKKKRSGLIIFLFLGFLVEIMFQTYREDKI